MTDMSFSDQVLTIAICAAMTMATRFVPFLLFRPGKALPAYVQYLGKALPAAVFAMLVVYCLRNVDMTGGTYGLPEWIATAVTCALHVWKRNMMLSMVVGTAVYMILVQRIFA